MTAGNGLTRLRVPLRLPDVRRMWLSDLLSVLGDHAAIIALAVLVYGRSHSVLAVALTSAAAFAPAFIVGPMLATFADRFAYRPILITCDLFRAVAYACILVPGLPVPIIIAIVFAAHCATFPFTAARAAQLPQIAGEAYGAAQALSQSTLQLGALIGYGVGGVLLSVVGSRGALLLDAGSFAISALLITRVSARARTLTDDSVAAPSPLARMKSGLDVLRRDPLLFWPAAMVTVAFIGTTAAETMAVVVARTLTHGAETGPLLALLLTLPVLVTLAATVLAPTEGDPYRLVRLSGSMAIGSQGLAVLGLLALHAGSLGLIMAIAAYAALGVSNAMTVPCVTVVGRRLPDNNRASVFSLLEALLIGGQAAGALLAGVAVTQLGIVAGLCVLLLPAIALCAVGITYLQTPVARHRAETHSLAA